MYSTIFVFLSGAAGFIISLNRIVTKELFEDVRVNTILFFNVSVFIVGVCFWLHRRIRKTEFVHFYLNICRNKESIVTFGPNIQVGN